MLVHDNVFNVAHPSNGAIPKREPKVNGSKPNIRI